MAEIKFIADENVGKLGRWLRLLGFDTRLFSGADRDLAMQALAENRVVLTRDTRIRLLRPAVGGSLKVITFATDRPEEQIRQIINQLGLKALARPFSRCLECNTPLTGISIEEARSRVPAYVYQTQPQYLACPGCGRVYWRGTHWLAMQKRLDGFAAC